MPRIVRVARRRWRRRLFWRVEALSLVVLVGLVAVPFAVCGFVDFRLFLAVTGTCMGSLLLTVALIAGATALATRFEPPKPPPSSTRINEQGEILRDSAPPPREKW